MNGWAAGRARQGDDSPPTRWHCAWMRTTFQDATVRLYHLADGPDGGSAETLCYAPLAQALQMAAEQPEEIQADLFIATENDVVAYLDLID